MVGFGNAEIISLEIKLGIGTIVISYWKDESLIYIMHTFALQTIFHLSLNFLNKMLEIGLIFSEYFS